MEVVKVCRICSIMDVKLHDLRSYPLESYYESVIGTNPQYENLPPFACYECAALVRKFYFFRQKCLRNQAVLHGATDAFGEVKPTDIKSIDRKGLHIASNLTITVLPNIDVLKPLKDKINQEIKLEPGSEDEDEKFKIEDHNYASFNSMDPSISSDDDEPLSLHKEKKVLNKDTDDEKVDLKVEFEGLEFAVGTEDSGHSIEVPKVVRKKKRGVKKENFKHKKELLNPCLDDDGKWNDFAQYIDVITLTLEEQKEEIQKRKESSNYLNSPFQCNLCFKGFIDNDAWNHHVSKHAVSAGSIECEVCKFRFKTKRAYQKHASNHEKKYACKSCPYISTNTTQAKQHQGWHKGVTFKCKFCDEIFTIWTSYMSHVRIKHPSEFICGFCGYSFISKLGLAMHKTMMHKDVQENDEEGPYCEECDVKFISMEAYKRHMVMSTKHTQTTDSIKGCRTCGATFENSEELRLHHRKEHTRKRPKNYGKKRSNLSWPAKCEHCTEEIPNAREYWTHFRRAHPDKKYPIQKNHICDICGKGFRGRYTALKSIRTDGVDAIEENPWVVYLRIAVSTSGLLNTGIGSLIDERWVLTTAANVVNARFIWIRYGAADVLNPALVTETSTVSIHPNYNASTGEHNIGLINTQRTIRFQANIAPVSLNSVSIGASAVDGVACVYVGTIHKTLHCFHINVAKDDNAGLGISGGDVQVSSDDFGSPLVIDGAQAALLVGLGDAQEIPGTYLETTDYVDWMQTETGVNLNPDADNDDNDSEVDPDPVRVVQ